MTQVKRIRRNMLSRQVVRKGFTNKAAFVQKSECLQRVLQAEKIASAKTKKGQIPLNMIGYCKNFVFHCKRDGKPSEDFKQKNNTIGFVL